MAAFRDMPELRTGDIRPGEGIGAFPLDEPWHELQARLAAAYSIERRRGGGGFAVKTATLWFLVDEETQRVVRITALGRFRGTLAGGGDIGLGATLSDVTHVLGPWTEREEGRYVVAAHPGVSFELGWIPGRDAAWQREHAPIEFISVYRRETDEPTA